eukprot:XP_001709446.1 Hypothetical protein GL50803_22731 [Giardia lamblia ATCC 50803]
MRYPIGSNFFPDLNRELNKKVKQYGIVASHLVKGYLHSIGKDNDKNSKKPHNKLNADACV